MWWYRYILTTLTAASMLAFAPKTKGIPPGRVGVHGYDAFQLLGNNAEIQEWEFISPGGSLIPDPDGDASPWQTGRRLSSNNRPCYVSSAICTPTEAIHRCPWIRHPGALTSDPAGPPFLL